MSPRESGKCIAFSRDIGYAIGEKRWLFAPERMFVMRRLSALLVFILVLLMSCPCVAENTAQENPVVVLRLEDLGDIYLEVYPSVAPVTAENFLKLVDSGFYNGLTFHRIISGFMMQGGDPNGNGTGGSSNRIRGEFSSNGFDNPLSHERGVVSMARSSDPDSASCQFFIMHENSTHLDGNYAAFGRVIAGMNVVDAVCMNAHVTDSNGTVPAEDQPRILSAERTERSEAEAAAALEAENGQAGGGFCDLATGVSFSMPEGWYLQSGYSGVYIFSDGTDTVMLSVRNYWQPLGKSAQAQYAQAGYDRAAMTTEVFSRAGFASSVGLTEESLKELEVNGMLWLAAAAVGSEGPVQYRMGAQNGAVIFLASDSDAGVQAIEEILASMRVE